MPATADHIQVAVIGNRLDAISNEIGQTMLRWDPRSRRVSHGKLLISCTYTNAFINKHLRNSQWIYPLVVFDYHTSAVYLTSRGSPLH